MDVGEVYARVSARLQVYLEELGMARSVGPERAMGELVRGILWSGSLQLTNAARLQTQRFRPLARTVNRLSHHLANRRWDHREWAAAILARQVQPLENDSLIPIDATELAKPYARHLEHLAIVRDASRVDDPLVAGYWCWGAYHWQPEPPLLSPLMLRPYSQAQPHFRSENDCWCQYLWALREATGGRGIWLSDRGGDRPEILAAFLRIQPRWIVRLLESRPLVGPDGSLRPAGAWADWALTHRAERGRAVTLPVRLPAPQIRQKPDAPALWLVVPTYTFGNDQRWLLLTCGLLDQHAGPRQVRHFYGRRWRAEDGKRLLGQLWHVERFLTRSWTALERWLGCVVAAGGFLRELTLEQPELARRLEEEVVYWPKPVQLPGYRLARGLQLVATATGHVTVAVNA